MASRRRSVSEQEAEEFRRAIGAVRPLADDRVHPAPSRPRRGCAARRCRRRWTRR